MAENSAIEWTSHTFNPWSGCTKVSAGCAHCYAEVNYSVRMRGVNWGPNGNRVVKAEAGWREPVKWNRTVECNVAHGGPRPRVFCASLADVFEDWTGPMLDSKGERLYFPHDSWNEKRPWVPISDCGGEEPPITMQEVRRRLFDLIGVTPCLDWLLLTKRPENIARMMPEWVTTGVLPQSMTGPNRKITLTSTGGLRNNVWLGTSVENKAAIRRIDTLRTIPAAVRFLSIEPLLEDLGPIDLTGIHWVIVGGESGPNSRPFDLGWARSIIEQCKAANVACFVKQMGAVPYLDRSPEPAASIARKYGVGPLVAQFIQFADKKGGDMNEWPEDLRVRQFPTVQA